MATASQKPQILWHIKGNIPKPNFRDCHGMWDMKVFVELFKDGLSAWKNLICPLSIPSQRFPSHVIVWHIFPVSSLVWLPIVDLGITSCYAIHDLLHVDMKMIWQLP